MTKQLFIKLCTFSLLLLLSSAAFSHAKSISSDPAARSVINRSPEFITVLFNQQLEPAYSTIVVTDSNNKSVTTVTAIVDSTNNKRLTLALPVLTPGKYTVSYKVLSLDGHVVKSTYTFRIKQGVSLAN
jgi:methionine-rich copper-binding protein CopC